MKDNKTAHTYPGADPVAGTVENPSEKLAQSAEQAPREAAETREPRDKLTKRPGPAEVSPPDGEAKD